ncbi:hypothetical protein TNCV_2635341 [Trichonephila clavipes]|nr:hypothetical protein TNCV_2635341 [Trichonephila clavipes]
MKGRRVKCPGKPDISQGDQPSEMRERTKTRCLGCQRNKLLIPRIKKKKGEEKCDIGKHYTRRGRPVEEEAKRERNRSDVTRTRVEERMKGAKSPKTHSRSTKTQ